ncbi:AAA family ATPase [Gelria sp. Kuro-4]|uniref:AAA family ATPase n=1 Tax=Gelria sp. Kuro-4 TaxID=2796927 RepID=UPI001BEF05A1|nr:AAA family ATPase [Gelria sp. Kuro-4]BCV26002.1 hypothetical protein kuro4_27750 [Gelria sp. Kuro-4]
MQQPPADEKVRQALRQVRERIEAALTALDSSEKPNLVLQGGESPIRLVDRRRKLSVEAAYIVHSDAEGFLGVFCGFASSVSESAEEPAHQIGDRAKQVVHELDLMFGGGVTNNEARPWLVCLFAVVPGPKEEQAFTRALNGFVFEPYNPLLRIGVSLITADEARDLQALGRFLAPLLLTTRKLTQRDPSQLRTAYGQKLLEKLEACLEETPAEDSADPVSYEKPAPAIRRRIVTEIAQRLADAVKGLEVKPPRASLTTIKEIEGLQHFRRFDAPRALHFKKKNLVFGLNGSGKTSLVQVLELGLTGQVREVRNQEAVRSFLSNKEPAAIIKMVLADEPGSTVEHRLLSSPPLLTPDAFATFCLRQTDYQCFVQCKPEERSEFLARALGMPVDELFERLNEMLGEVRRIARNEYPDMKKDPGWNYERSFQTVLQSKLAGVVRRDDFNKTWEFFQKVHQSLRSLLSTYPTLCEDAYESVRDLASKVARWSQQCNEILDMLAAGPVPQSRLEEAASFLTRARERAAAALAAVQDMLHDLEAPIRAYLASETDRLKAEEVPAGEALADKEALLQRVQYALSSVRTLEPVQEATRSAAASLDTWWSKLQSFLASESPVEDKGEFPVGVYSKIVEIRAFAQALAARTAWAEHVKALRELEAYLADPALVTGASQLEQKRRDLATQVAQLQGAVRGSQGPDHQPRRNLAVALRAHGMEVPEALLNATSVRALQSYLTALSSLAAVLTTLWDQAAWEKVAGTILHFYDYPDVASHVRAGAYYYFTYLDVLEQEQKDMREAVSAWLKEVVEEELEKSFLEFLYLLTSFSWGFLYPTMTPDIDGKNRVSLGFSFHEKINASDILNQAEKSLAGLSWFLMAYLLAGREYSSVLILDDPFQHLDETNASSFMRALDLMDRVFNVGQIIVTLHERDIYDSLLRLWAVIPSRPAASAPFGTTTASIILRQNEFFTSDIQEFHLQTRYKSVSLDKMVELVPIQPASIMQLNVTF